MKQTSFLWQVYIGLRQEFQAAFRHQRLRLLFLYLTPMIFTLFHLLLNWIINDFSSKQNPLRFSFIYIDEIFQSALYYSSAVIISRKFIRDRKFKIMDFTVKNGMRPSAYMTKSFLAENILLLPVALLKVVELHYLASFTEKIEISFMLEIFMVYLVTSFAIVNLYFLLSRLFSEKDHILLINALNFGSYLVFVYLLGFKYFESLNGSNNQTLTAAFGVVNPALLLVGTLREMYKKKLCVKGCQNYASESQDPKAFLLKYHQCGDFFSDSNTNETPAVMKNIHAYCISEETNKGHKLPIWVQNLIILLIIGMAYLILRFLFNKGIEFRSWISNKYEEYKRNRARTLTLQKPLISRSSNTSSQRSSLSNDASQVILNVDEDFQTMFENLTVKIRKGEILCLLGENGTGQSTLINILAGLKSSFGGTISYNNREYNLLEFSKLTGYCSQTNNYFLENTIDENLNFFAHLGGKKIYAKKMRKDFGLKDEADKSDPILVSQLSADQKMMLNTAIVLLSDPEVIIMDEPTTELDSSAKIAFEELIRNLKVSQKTVIFTTQHVKDAELADGVVILKKKSKITDTLTHFKERKLRGKYILTISLRGEETSRVKTKKSIEDLVFQRLVGSIPLDTMINSVLKYEIPYQSVNKEQLIQFFSELSPFSDVQVSFKRRSLDEYLEKTRESNLHQPEIESESESEKRALSASESFRLKKQIWAIILMKFHTWKRTRRLLFFVFFYALQLILASTPIPKNSTGEFEPNSLFVLWPMLLLGIGGGFFIISLSIIEIVKQRKSHQSHTLNIMGLNPWSYWLGNFIADLAPQLLIALAYLLFEYFLHIDTLTQVSHIVAFLNVVAFSYRLSLNSWLKNSQNFYVLVFFSFLFSFILLLFIGDSFIAYILYLGLDILTLFFPSFPIQFFIGAIPVSFLTVSFLTLEFSHETTALSLPIKLFEILVMCISIGITLWRLAYIDSIPFKIPKKQANQVNPMNSHDVTNDETEIHQDFLTFTGVFKKEKQFKESRILNVTFDLPRGSILGLIGDNSSGKSELLDLYARETIVSDGKILLQGEELPCPYKSRVKIGVCLSTNTLWNDLSLRQHLEIYARIKGVPSLQVKKAAIDLIAELDLIYYADLQIRRIEEEGIKRKLSLALAVIGAPDLILLDEPTKGLDPIGRKQVWKVLKELTSKNNKESAIIMATNQIRDAELKADRIGIMVNKELEKIGLVETIKQDNKVYLKIEGIKQLENDSQFNALRQNIPLKAEHFEFVSVPGDVQEGKITFKVSQQNAKESFSAVFSSLVDDMDREDIKDFSLSEKPLNEEYEDLLKKKMQESRLNNANLPITVSEFNEI